MLRTSRRLNEFRSILKPTPAFETELEDQATKIPAWLTGDCSDPLEVTCRNLVLCYMEKLLDQYQPANRMGFLIGNLRKMAHTLGAALVEMRRLYGIGHLHELKLHPDLPSPDDSRLCEVLGIVPGVSAQEEITLDEVFAELVSRRETVPRPRRLPTPEEVEQAEAELGFAFPPQYRRFQLEASHVVYGMREPGVIVPEVQYPSLRRIASDGWSLGIPKDHLPFCIDNGNYFTVDASDSVGYYDHDDGTHTLLGGDFMSWVLEDWLEEQ